MACGLPLSTDVRRSFVNARNAAGTLIGLAMLSLPAAVFGQGVGISRVTASRISSSSATIAWSTAVRSDSQVLYGPAAAYGNLSPRDSSMVEFHSQTLTGLLPGTMYHFRVQSAGEDGTISFSSDFIFLTSPADPNLDSPPVPVFQPTPSPSAVPARAVLSDAGRQQPVPAGPKPAETPSAAAPSKVVTTNEQNRKGTCDTPDPYAASGGVGLCVDGRWIELWKSSSIPPVPMRKRGGK